MSLKNRYLLKNIRNCTNQAVKYIKVKETLYLLVLFRYSKYVHKLNKRDLNMNTIIQEWVDV